MAASMKSLRPLTAAGMHAAIGAGLGKELLVFFVDDRELRAAGLLDRHGRP